MDRRKLVLGVLAVAACSPTTPPPTMPAAAPGSVTADPIRSAMLEAAGYFRRPQPNQPAATARAIADIEFLAETVPRDPRWQASPAQALTQLQQARSEGRRALGIPASAPPQSVIDGLQAAATALDANDRAALAPALPRSIFSAGPDATVQRLSAPPRIPSAGAALASLGGGSNTQR